MERIILDTDVASFSFKGSLPPELLRRLVGCLPYISFTTLGELTKWADQNHWQQRRRRHLEHWLSGVVVLPGTERVARTWGRISASAALRGRPQSQNDTWIAACCLAYEMPLATLNVKHFREFAEHDALTLVIG